MGFILYILQSAKSDKLYIGQTQNLEERLNRHNKGYSKSTKYGIPWEIIYTEQFPTRSGARKREKYLKDLKSPQYILKNIVCKN